jgi:hypothetical protein
MDVNDPENTTNHQPTKDDTTMNDFNVYDGPGEQVKQRNHQYRLLIRSMHHRYKNAGNNGEKKRMAEDIYMHIRSKGGNFFNDDKSIKPYADAVQKIQKALKDMKEGRRRSGSHSIDTSIRSASTEDSNNETPNNDPSNTKTSPFGNEAAGAFHVSDGTGGRVHQLNENFRIIIRSAHQRYKNASTNAERKSLAENVYRFIRSKGGQFYNVDGTEKPMRMAIQKVRKALKDMREPSSAPTSLNHALDLIWESEEAMPGRLDPSLVASSNSLDPGLLSSLDSVDFFNWMEQELGSTSNHHHHHHNVHDEEEVAFDDESLSSLHPSD